MANILPKKKNKSVIDEVLERKRAVADESYSGNFKVSFQYLDSASKYASSYKDWQKEGLLSKTLEVLQGYCCRPLIAQVDKDKFTIYGDFPHPDYTRFEKPQHVPPDAKWARIHINGPSVLVGHVVQDTFYLVFLDKTHKFWLTKKSLAN